MKNKIYVILAIIGMFVVVAFATSLSGGGKPVRFHQHKEVAEKEPVDDTNVFSSKLPLISIDTRGQKMPGSPLLNKEGKRIGYELTEYGEDKIVAEVSVFDQKESDNTLSDPITLQSEARMRIRGNSSRYFDKKGYLIQLVNEEGTKENLPIMGMGAHNEWALHGPFLDKTMIRNYMWYNIGAEITGYAPNVRYSELFLDGEYQGLYLMTETIAASDERVPLGVYGNGKSVTSWIARLDTYEEADWKSLDHYGYYTLKTSEKSGISVIYPSRNNMTERNKEYIEKDISGFEKTLYSYDFKDPKKGYRAHIDVDSFVDYYILMEFLAQNDMANRSTYLTKDARSKISMSPLWDFNNILDNYIALVYTPEEFYFTDRLWYEMLLRDDYFVEKVIRRYRELRKTWLDEDYLLSYIDETLEFLEEPIQRNFEVWGYTFDPDTYERTQYLYPYDRNPRSHEEAIQQMTEFLVARGKWMDTNIEALRQFSHQSKNKQYDKD